jgi:hypothetical protein
MATKFNPGDKVLHNEEEKEVLTSTKNFKTGTIVYRLSTGELVNEGELSSKDEKKGKAAGKDEKNLLLEALTAKYEELYGKPVAPAKKNNADWIEEKIKEKLQEKKEGNQIPKFTMEDLNDLVVPDLLKLIEEKQLDIDPELYEGDEEGLRQAIAEELNIEVK